ncbi:hypothetical protein TPS_01519 [Trichinella pseudospiralis]
MPKKEDLMNLFIMNSYISQNSTDKTRQVKMDDRHKKLSLNFFSFCKEKSFCCCCFVKPLVPNGYLLLLCMSVGGMPGAGIQNIRSVPPPLRFSVHSSVCCT